MSKPSLMSLADFKRLTKRDFTNGAVLDEIYSAIKDREQLQEVAEEMAEALRECFEVLEEPGIMDVDQWKAWRKSAVIKAHAALAKWEADDA